MKLTEQEIRNILYAFAYEVDSDHGDSDLVKGIKKYAKLLKRLIKKDIEDILLTIPTARSEPKDGAKWKHKAEGWNLCRQKVVDTFFPSEDESNFIHPNGELSLCIYCGYKVGLDMKCIGCGSIDPPVKIIKCYCHCHDKKLGTDFATSDLSTCLQCTTAGLCRIRRRE